MVVIEEDGAYDDEEDEEVEEVEEKKSRKKKNYGELKTEKVEGGKCGGEFKK